jgi:hypothetical protein
MNLLWGCFGHFTKLVEHIAKIGPDVSPAFRWCIRMLNKDPSVVVLFWLPFEGCNVCNVSVIPTFGPIAPELPLIQTGFINTE